MTQLDNSVREGPQLKPVTWIAQDGASTAPYLCNTGNERQFHGYQGPYVATLSRSKR